MLRDGPETPFIGGLNRRVGGRFPSFIHDSRLLSQRSQSESRRESGREGYECAVNEAKKSPGQKCQSPTIMILIV